MLTATIVFIVLTFLILIYALFLRNPENFVRIKEVYKDKYIRETEYLEDRFAKRLITKREYEAKTAALGRDLLDVAQEGRKIPWFGILFFVVLGTVISAGAGYFFWNTYDQEMQKFDQMHTDYRTDLQKWVDDIKLADLRKGDRITDYPLPPSVIEEPSFVYRELNRMSTKSNHSDPKLLYLLGGFYWDSGNLSTAYTTYFDLSRIEEDQFYVYGALLTIEFAQNDYQLTPEIEMKFDALIRSFPEEFDFTYAYANYLIKNNRIDKGLHYYRMIQDNAPTDLPVAKNVAVFFDELEMMTKIMKDQSVGNIKEQQGVADRLNLKSDAKVAKGYQLGVTLFIDDASLKTVPDTSVLYIYIRSPEQKMGPPLAARQIPYSQISWNKPIYLSDQDLIMPNSPSLNSFDELIVSARLSIDGTANRGDADLDSNKVTIMQNDKAIALYFGKIPEQRKESNTIEEKIDATEESNQEQDRIENVSQESNGVALEEPLALIDDIDQIANDSNSVSKEAVLAGGVDGLTKTSVDNQSNDEDKQLEKNEITPTFQKKDAPVEEESLEKEKNNSAELESSTEKNTKEQASLNHEYQLLVTLSMSSELKENIPAEGTIYIFLKNAAIESDTPIAARKIMLHDAKWNQPILITDKDRMLLNAPTLSSYDDISVAARISLSGTVTKKKGDWETEVLRLTPSDHEVQLQFNKVAD